MFKVFRVSSKVEATSIFSNIFNLTIEEIAEELELSIVTVKQYLSNFKNKKYTVLKEDKSKYDTMSTADMAEEMCIKLKEMNCADGEYSLQVYAITEGDIIASKLDFRITGHTLHYSSFRNSYVDTQQSWFIGCYKQHRTDIWFESSIEKMKNIEAYNKRAQEAMLCGY